MQAQLIHSVHESIIGIVLRDGLKAASRFDSLGLDMRRGVIYCWLRKEDDKMWRKRSDYVYVRVSVDQDRCRVAEMDFASLALMYLQGDTVRPENKEAAHLLAEVYRVTSVPLSEYEPGIFSTPEVLVKGDISPDYISLVRA